MLKEIFEKERPAGSKPGASPPGPRRRPAGRRSSANEDVGGAVLSEESVVVGKIKLEADVRTNRIHVITRPINMPFIEKLIAEFDANVEFAKPVTRPLKYISAGDVLPVLVQALTEPGIRTSRAADPQQGSKGGIKTAQNRSPNAKTPEPVRELTPAGRRQHATGIAKSFPPTRSIPRRRRSPSATPRSSPTSAPTRSSCSAIARSWSRSRRSSTKWT